MPSWAAATLGPPQCDLHSGTPARPLHGVVSAAADRRGRPPEAGSRLICAKAARAPGAGQLPAGPGRTPAAAWTLPPAFSKGGAATSEGPDRFLTYTSLNFSICCSAREKESLKAVTRPPPDRSFGEAANRRSGQEFASSRPRLSRGAGEPGRGPGTSEGAEDGSHGV